MMFILIKIKYFKALKNMLAISENLSNNFVSKKK